jgi:hypothetical protein
MPIPQLTRLKDRENFSSHALVSIVRLTVETNLVTSKDLQVFDVMMRHPCLTLVQPLSVSYHY